MASSNSRTERVYRVGIICGSQRAVRAGPQIADFVADVIGAQLELDSAAARRPCLCLDRIDVATLGLPLTDEPGVPSQIRTAEAYAHAHTQTWSRRVAALDGVVFVTPQYNWGVPAGLKNAIDHLFHEWAGKPALVVAYGGHGGDKAATALAMVLGGLRMRAVQEPVLLAFPDRQTTERAAGGLDLGLAAGGGDDSSALWADRQQDIVAGWSKLVALMV